MHPGVRQESPGNCPKCGMALRKAGLPTLAMATPRTALGPVCGMAVEVSSAAGRSKFQGKEYLSCSRHCFQRFEADPRRFVGPDAKREAMPKADEPKVAVAAGDYVCP